MNSLISSCFDETIIDDSYWTQPSSPSSSYGWDDTHLNDIAVYFPYSSGPSSPSTLKSEDNDKEWRIEYQRTIKKIRPDQPELQYDYYIDNHGICRPYGYIPASMLQSRAAFLRLSMSYLL